MKAAFFLGSRRIEVREVDRPKIEPREVLVKVGVCSICGSDLHAYTQPYETKTILGHEITGTIVEVGREVSGFKKNERVAVYAIVNCGKCYYCRRGLTQLCHQMKIIGGDMDGGYAEYVRVPERCLLKIPEEITLEEASLLLDTIGVPVHGLKRLDAHRDHSVIVYGCGPIGLATIHILRLRGLRKIFAVDLVDFRLRAAKEMGAQVVINAREEDPVKKVKKLTDGLGADMAIDASGAPAAETNALKSVRRHGKVLFMGMNPTGKLDIDLVQQLMYSDATLIGTFYFSKSEFDENVQLFLRGRDKFRKIITHTFPLEQINYAFQLFEQKKTLRVLVKP